jgi:hypothetical protein
MTLEPLIDRLVTAHDRLASLRAPVEDGAPWPRSEHFGVEPEASWMPPELLAHVAEMLPFWRGQIERILNGYPEPVSFGRVQSDEERIAAIARDRELPAGELFDRIAANLGDGLPWLRSLSDAQAAKLGTHPTLGEMSVARVVERMLAGHLEEHVAQLETILARRAG